MVKKIKEDYKPVTAAESLAAYDEKSTDAEELREEAGVVHVAYVDYDKALKNYESRSDIETLESRQARENGTKFEVNDFQRVVADEYGGVVVPEKAMAAASEKDGQTVTTKDATSKTSNK